MFNNEESIKNVAADLGVEVTEGDRKQKCKEGD